MKNKVLNRIISLLCVVGVTVSILSATKTQAATALQYSESEVTWLGSAAEYQNALKYLFPKKNYGLRLVSTGTPSDNGIQNKKYGLMNQSGEFVLDPIYDSIEALYINDLPKLQHIVNRQIFVNGYAQITQDGKMGLIDKTGKIVVPVKYDAVGIPSEGMSRIIKDKKLGYYDVKNNKQVVSPKYPVTGQDASAAGSKRDTHRTDDPGELEASYWHIDDVTGTVIKFNPAKYDFNDGYAFVPTRTKSVTIGKTYKNVCSYGTIINKKGKNILPKKEYLYDSHTNPQYGPYMVYCEKSKKRYMFGKVRKIDCGYYWMSGVVGKKGVVIKAQYTGGVVKNPGIIAIDDADMRVIPDKKLVLTSKDIKVGENLGSQIGVINFKNKQVIPFTEKNYSMYYSQKHQCIYFNSAGSLTFSSKVYNTKGKRIKIKKSAQEKCAAKLKKPIYSGVPGRQVVSGTAINGNTVIYDCNGKLLMSDKYKKIAISKTAKYCVVTDANNNVGVYNLEKKKLVIPCLYDSVNMNFSEEDLIYPCKDKQYYMFDGDGNQLVDRTWSYPPEINAGVYSETTNSVQVDLRGVGGVKLFGTKDGFGIDKNREVSNVAVIVKNGNVGVVQIVKRPPVSIEEKYSITNKPMKLDYMLHEPFDPTGIVVNRRTTDNTIIDITADVTYSCDGVKLTPGTYKFQSAGTHKKISVNYNGKEVTSYEINVSTTEYVSGVYTVNKTEGSIYRSTPLLEIKSSGTIPYGTQVTVDGVFTNGTFGRVKMGDKFYYIWMENLTKVQ